MKKWTIEDAKELYNINGWGTPYFSVNERGNVYVTPEKDKTQQVDLHDVMEELALRGVSPPVLLRFPDILDNRIEETAKCFDRAREDYGFKGENFIIYPIKVNQMQPVVEEIISHGRKFNLGLEAGSKPELHAVIAVQCQSDSLIVCNGYKDQSYIELALLAQKMGKRIFIVVEKLNEIDTIAQVARRMKVRPNIGIRIKLASSGSGKWAESGGDMSKFGLTASEVLAALEKLEKAGLQDCLRLIHFHIGSQITKIRRIQTALNEAAEFYANLRKMGYDVDFVDCGGGLGVDYDGTRSSNSESSINYSIQEYVNDCVDTFVQTADKYSSMQRTRTIFPTPTSSPKADATSLPIIACSSSTCWRQPRCPRCRKSLRPRRATTNSSRTSMRSGTTLTRARCWRTGTTRNRYARRHWNCSPTAW